MKIFLNILIFLASWFLLGCEETIDWNTNDQAESLLVVEALLTNEKKRHEVKLSLTRSELSDQTISVDDALVFIHDGETTFQLSPDPNQPGVFLTDSMRALFSKVYSLFIAYDGNEYFSASYSSFGSPIDEPLITEETDDGLLEFKYQESSSPSMMEVEVRLPNTNASDLPDIVAYYYTLEIIEVNKVFAPEKEEIIFPKGSQVTRKKYSLTENHQDFLRSLLSEIDWRGGLFDVAAGNVNTNLSEGAVGYFAVSMITTDITVVE